MKMKNLMVCVFAALSAVMEASASVHTASEYQRGNLIAQWDGIENVSLGGAHDSTASIWADLSGNGYDMTLTAAGSFVDGLALQSSAVSPFYAASSTEKITNARTVEVVFLIDTFKNEPFILHLSDSQAIEYYNAKGGVSYRNALGTAGVVMYDATKPIHQFVLSNDGLGMSGIFRQGEEEDFDPNQYGAGLRHKTLHMGGRDGDGNSLVGRIFAVRVYSTQLDRDQLYRHALLDRARFFGDAEAEAELALRRFVVDAIPDQKFRGIPCRPALVVREAETGKVLEENHDYRLDYADNAAIGVAHVTVTGIGGHTDTAVCNVTFAIVEAKEYYVDQSVSESGDGLTIQTAFKTIEEGVAAANAKGSGWSVAVLDSDRPYVLAATVSLNAGVALYSLSGDRTKVILDGGHKVKCIELGKGGNISHVTIQNGYVAAGETTSDVSGSGLTASGAAAWARDIVVRSCMVHVPEGLTAGRVRASVTLTSGACLYDSVVENCTNLIEGTATTGASGGGGIATWDGATNCRLENVIVRNCRMLTKSITAVGGGFYSSCTTVDWPYLSRCVISNNVAQKIGSTTSGGESGGFYAPKAFLTNCLVAANTAYGNGGAFATTANNIPHYVNCTFRDNWAAGNGGAVYTQYNDGFRIEGCVFEGNTAEGSGGACHFWRNSGSPSGLRMISNCVFSNNKATSSGGGLYLDGQAYNAPMMSAVVSNCVFSANSASAGGGLYAHYLGGASHVESCLFVGNTTSGLGAGFYYDFASTAETAKTSTNMWLRNSMIIKNTGKSALVWMLGKAVNDEHSFCGIESCTIADNVVTDKNRNAYDLSGDSGVSRTLNCIITDNVGENTTYSRSSSFESTLLNHRAKFGEGGYALRASSPSAKTGFRSDWMAGATNLGDGVNWLVEQMSDFGGRPVYVGATAYGFAGNVPQGAGAVLPPVGLILLLK